LNYTIKLSFASFLIFLIGCLIGYSGYEHVPPEETIGKSMFLVLPVEPTALDYMTNNISVTMVIMFGGILTLGAVAAGVLFFNGVIVGESAVAALDKMPAGEVLVKIVPHGLFEVPALLLAGAGGFLSLRIIVTLLREKKVNYRSELLNAGWLAIAVVLLLAVAAAVEAHITPALAAWLYGAIE
jgi:stage II sporulation protein M